MSGAISADTFAQYVRVITFYMIFSAMVELISPSGCYKKYIRLVLSLVLIALLIQPISALLGGASGILEENSLKYGAIFDNKALGAQRDEYDEQNAKAVIDEYTKSLAEQTKTLIETRTGIACEEVNIVVNEDYGSELFASVLGVHVTASIPGREEESDIKKILFGNANAQISGEELKTAAEQKIKNCLADFYNISDSNIHITVQEHR